MAESDAVALLRYSATLAVVRARDYERAVRDELALAWYTQSLSTQIGAWERIAGNRQGAERSWVVAVVALLLWLRRRAEATDG